MGWSGGEQGPECAVGEFDCVELADNEALQFGIVVEVRLRVLRVGVEADRPAHGIRQGSAAIGVADDNDRGGGLPRPLVAVALNADGCPVSGSAESMMPSVPVINGMPSASIAHIAATGVWPVRWTVWPVGRPEKG